MLPSFFLLEGSIYNTETICNFTMNFDWHNSLVWIISWRNLVKKSRLRQIIMSLNSHLGANM